MHTPPLFADLLIILLASLPVAYVCLRLKLPLLVGLMLTGIVIGPYGLGLIKELEAIEILAEIGVILLLFTIGLEFSIKRLREIKNLVLIGGGLQVVLTVAATAVVAFLFGRQFNQAVFFGFLVALSSTAIVLKSYADRQETDAPHGRAGIGILLFQDVSIVLMMLLVPILGGQDAASVGAIAKSLGFSLGALIVIVAGAWFLVPFLLKKVVASAKSRSFAFDGRFDKSGNGLDHVAIRFVARVGRVYRRNRFVRIGIQSSGNGGHSAVPRCFQQSVFRFHRNASVNRRVDRKFFDRFVMGCFSGRRENFDHLVGRAINGFSAENGGDDRARFGADRRIFVRAGKSRTRRTIVFRRGLSNISRRFDHLDDRHTVSDFRRAEFR